MHQPTRVERQRPVCPGRQRKIVRHDHKPQPHLAGQCTEELVESLRIVLIQIATWLVGKQYRRSGRQRPGHRGPLLFAARELGGPMVTSA